MVFAERGPDRLGKVASLNTGPIESAADRRGAGATLGKMSPARRQRTIERCGRAKPGKDHPEEPEAIEVRYAITASVLP